MSDDRKYWAGFNQVRGVGPVRIRALLDHFGDLRSAWLASAGELRRAGLSRKLASEIVRLRTAIDLDALWIDCARSGIDVLTWLDRGYPHRLLEIDHPPPVLYAKGTFEEQDLWSVAIVGTRRITSYGRYVTAELAGFLARSGITVVSGLARGVDTIAHRAALEAGGRTIAVLGCGVDQVYPPENASLVEAMVAGGRGAVISDYAPGTPPEGPNFPPRNRIIAGLALAVVVVEAGIKSGALITANFALEQGREIIAVPGQITAPQSVGCNRLIRSGAHPYLEPSDVLEILDWVRVVQYPADKRPAPEPGLERAIFEIISSEPRHIDEVCAEIGEPVGRVSAALTMMELKGLVRQTGGMKYVSVRF